MSERTYRPHELQREVKELRAQVNMLERENRRLRKVVRFCEKLCGFIFDATDSEVRLKLDVFTSMQSLCDKARGRLTE